VPTGPVEPCALWIHGSSLQEAQLAVARGARASDLDLIPGSTLGQPGKSSVLCSVVFRDPSAYSAGRDLTLSTIARQACVTASLFPLDSDVPSCCIPTSVVVNAELGRLDIVVQPSETVEMQAKIKLDAIVIAGECLPLGACPPCIVVSRGIDLPAHPRSRQVWIPWQSPLPRCCKRRDALRAHGHLFKHLCLLFRWITLTRY